MPYKENSKVRKPPVIGPYVLTWLLIGLGLWCIYDGFITTAPDMQKHMWFNRITGVLLLCGAVADFFRLRKKLKKSAMKAEIPTSVR